ncbi:magnesium chelatase family protein [Jatrophihabitans endophyticus]|uniref:Magnesium chelatase family protein n=1 Tax=Jatrophihabitans endophyticus TaxID=1206085 RepID=A0A1M5CCQ3_9ACTN|nr:YifB family Mg chelatase-like AAA ATPase [Jatrophihabitans endophyticus]SHF52377.1 magnesium chelatase family protein [Jatrophihabitans endophyticus]
MGLAKTLAVGLSGIDGHVVEVECDISAGLPGMSFTGRADGSVVESRDRLRAAVHNCGADWPNRKITVALLPADTPKRGSRFDLAVGLAVLAADGQLPPPAVAAAAWIAELGLTGALRPVRGVLPAVVAARAHGVERVVVARANAAEAALVDGVDVRAADDLGQIVRWLTGEGPALDRAAVAAAATDGRAGPDLADVAGQGMARRALEITAAGGHHLYLVGSPGAGKTMLAERLPDLLPPLDDAAALEVTAIHSIAGLLGEGATLVRRPPIRAPHHTASLAALVGGGSHLARPGAISLAHRGVLFLDEAPEFAPASLDALRQPLESGTVVLLRAGGAVTYPARFQLVLAANPCSCAARPSECVCSAHALRRHRQRLSGPLMDRIDLRVRVEPVARAALLDRGGARESTAEVAQRVAEARRRAVERWAPTGLRVNADIPGSVLRSRQWLPPAGALQRAEELLERGELSARGFDRVLRTAWTIADLAGVPALDRDALEEALFFRAGTVEASAA